MKLLMLLYMALLSGCADITYNDGLDYMDRHNIYLMFTVPIN